MQQKPPYSVWVTYLAYADKPDKGKVRPILIIPSPADTIAVLKITSSPPSDKWNDVAIEEWKKAGLLRESSVRCSHIFELTSGDLANAYEIGQLQLTDIEKVVAALRLEGFDSARD